MRKETSSLTHPERRPKAQGGEFARAVPGKVIRGTSRSRNLWKNGRPRRVAWAILPFLVLLLTGCGGRITDPSSSSVSYGSSKSDSSQAQFFTVPQEQMGRVQVVSAEVTTLQRVLRLAGSVTYNSYQTTPVLTQVSGPVTRILVYPGQVVRAGQPMLYVSSPDYAQMRSGFLKARDALQLAQKNASRAEDLYAHHAIAQADLEQAETVRSQAEADLQAAEQSLRVLGIHPDHAVPAAASPEISVLAPIAGEVVERLAAPGQVIQAGATQVFTISDMSTVWVLANVYEQDLGYVHLSDPVAIRTDAYPDIFHGRISYIAPAVDAATRTLQVRIVTRNPGGKLKKDMYVTAVVQAGVIRNALTVPDAAVLRNAENQPFVYVEEGTDQFGQRLVDTGEAQDGKIQIVSGLKPGERVVADGSLFLQFANSIQK